MKNHLNTVQIMCPYCGEHFEVITDCSAGDQEYVEDCQICCAPIEISIQVSASGELESIHVKRDSD